MGDPLLPAYRRSGFPAAVSGDWSLVAMELPERPYQADPDPRPAAFHFRPGRYTELRRAGITYMTDLYDEWWTQRVAIMRARAVGGDVLITGLGLGMVAEAILAPGAPAAVGTVTVLEQAQDVIDLVRPHLQPRWGERLQIVHADAFEWRAASGQRFATVWHDIWPDPDAPQVDAEVASLLQHHQPWSDWQGFWPIDYRAARDL